VPADNIAELITSNLRYLVLSPIITPMRREDLIKNSLEHSTNALYLEQLKLV
jgi:hypothetical protein